MSLKVLAFVVAFFSAGIGVGGGCLLVPFLLTFFNYDFRKAASISLSTIIPISLVGSASYLFFISKIPPFYYFIYFIPSCVFGALLGGLFIKNFNGRLPKLVFSFFILVVGIKMLGAGNMTFFLIDYLSVFSRGNILLLLPLGIIIGAIATNLGVGCGLLIVPLFVTFFDFSMHEAITMSLTTMFFITSTATIIHKKYKTLNWAIVKRMIPFAFIGAVIGALLSSHLPNSILKMMFAIFLLTIASKFLLEELMPLILKNKNKLFQKEY
ncbi:MAG: sulfite exporter TauE/SafE family protein [Bacteriovoracaceae bacterium]|nr:sulfite exporter TauE/SafE family protein [Bacteriovoracaceae bacterium]